MAQKSLFTNIQNLHNYTPCMGAILFVIHSNTSFKVIVYLKLSGLHTYSQAALAFYAFCVEKRTDYEIKTSETATFHVGLERNNVTGFDLIHSQKRCNFHVLFPVSNNASNEADSSSFCISVTSIGSITFSGNQAFNSEADNGGLVSRLLGSRSDRNIL